MSGPVTKADALKQAMNALALLDADELAQTQFYGMAYVMNPQFPLLLAQARAIGPTASQKMKQKRGELLEQAVLALFAGVRAVSHLESWQGPLGQHDLLLRTSSNNLGELIRKALYDVRLDALIEVKATAGKVDTATMARFCAMLTLHFPVTASFGILVALKGITGGNEERKASDAHLARLLFYANCAKPVVVLNEADLVDLSKGANLIGMLRLKMDALERGRATDHASAKKWASVPTLPTHLDAILDLCGLGALRGGPQP